MIEEQLCYFIGISAHNKMSDILDSVGNIICITYH